MVWHNDTREGPANAILYVADSQALYESLGLPALRVFKIGQAGGVFASFDCCERLNGRHVSENDRYPRPMGYNDWRPIRCLFVAGDNTLKNDLRCFERALHTRLAEFEREKGILRYTLDLGKMKEEGSEVEVLSFLTTPKGKKYGAESEIHAVHADNGGDFQDQILNWSHNYLDKHVFKCATLTCDEVRDKIKTFMDGLVAYVLDKSSRITECGGACLNGKLKSGATMCAEAFG